MKPKPPSKLARLYKSHSKLLRLVRGQIQELGELRKVILEMRDKGKEYEVPPLTEDRVNPYLHGDPMYDFRANDWPRL